MDEDTAAEFAQIVEGFKDTPEARPRSKWRALAQQRADRRTARKLKFRQLRCRLTFPFGHFYEERKNERGYNSNVCVWCERIEKYNDPEVSPAGITIIIMGTIITLLLLYILIS